MHVVIALALVGLVYLFGPPTQAAQYMTGTVGSGGKTSEFKLNAARKETAEQLCAYIAEVLKQLLLVNVSQCVAGTVRGDNTLTVNVATSVVHKHFENDVDVTKLKTAASPQPPAPSAAAKETVGLPQKLLPKSSTVQAPATPTAPAQRAQATAQTGLETTPQIEELTRERDVARAAGDKLQAENENLKSELAELREKSKAIATASTQPPSGMKGWEGVAIGAFSFLCVWLLLSLVNRLLRGKKNRADLELRTVEDTQSEREKEELEEGRRLISALQAQLQEASDFAQKWREHIAPNGTLDEYRELKHKVVPRYVARIKELEQQQALSAPVPA